MFVNWFIKSSQKVPQRPALEVANLQMSYQELGLLASKIAQKIQKQKLFDSPIGLLAYRSFTCYAGVLSIFYSKNTYLPLNPNFPLKRTQKMIEMVGCKALVVGAECSGYLLKLLPTLSKPMTFILPSTAKIDDLSSDYGHKFIFSNELEDAREFNEIENIDEDAIAYLVFTSGSTGEPKIVQQSYKNVITYLDYVAKKYDLNQNDRVSQTFELTFDNSIHDMFICWKYGACLY